ALCLALCFFFFSSRRRHTRFSRDWSSDVCSSDLAPAVGADALARGEGERAGAVDGVLPGVEELDDRVLQQGGIGGVLHAQAGQRSEERRVGKEGSAGRSASG